MTAARLRVASLTASAATHTFGAPQKPPTDSPTTYYSTSAPKPQNSALSARTKQDRCGVRSELLFEKQLKLANFFFRKLRRFFDYINRDSLLKQVPRDFASFFQTTTVFPASLFNISHHCANHISCTKIKQFHFVLQDLEYGGWSQRGVCFIPRIFVYYTAVSRTGFYGLGLF